MFFQEILVINVIFKLNDQIFFFLNTHYFFLNNECFHSENTDACVFTGSFEYR